MYKRTSLASTIVVVFSVDSKLIWNLYYPAEAGNINPSSLVSAKKIYTSHNNVLTIVAFLGGAIKTFVAALSI